MKRKNNFLKTLPKKLYLLLAAALFFCFFSNDFGLVDIQKTAIILAAGLDKEEDDFHVTLQIAVPKGNKDASGSTSNVNIEGYGKTVSDCVANIYAKTGWVPKFLFCNLLLIGEDYAKKEDVFGGLDFFLRNEYMQDSCLVAVCEGTAAQMLLHPCAIEDSSSTSIEKLFSSASEKSGRVMKNTLKDFSIGYYGVSGSGYLPYVRAQEQGKTQPPTEGDQSGGEQASGGNKVFSAERTALFSKGKMTAIIPEAQTFALSILEGNVSKGIMLAEENGTPVTVAVLKGKGGAKLERGDTPKVKLTASVVLRIYDRGDASDIVNISERKVSEEALQSVKEELSAALTGLWNNCVQADCDLFYLLRTLYRTSPKEYAKWKDTLLPLAELEVEAKTKTVHE